MPTDGQATADVSDVCVFPVAANEDTVSGKSRGATWHKLNPTALGLAKNERKLPRRPLRPFLISISLVYLHDK